MQAFKIILSEVRLTIDKPKIQPLVLLDKISTYGIVCQHKKRELQSTHSENIRIVLEPSFYCALDKNCGHHEFYERRFPFLLLPQNFKVLDQQWASKKSSKMGPRKKVFWVVTHVCSLPHFQTVLHKIPISQHE